MPLPFNTAIEIAIDALNTRRMEYKRQADLYLSGIETTKSVSSFARYEEISQAIEFFSHLVKCDLDSSS